MGCIYGPFFTPVGVWQNRNSDQWHSEPWNCCWFWEINKLYILRCCLCDYWFTPPVAWVLTESPSNWQSFRMCACVRAFWHLMKYLATLTLLHWQFINKHTPGSRDTFIQWTYTIWGKQNCFEAARGFKFTFSHISYPQTRVTIRDSFTTTVAVNTIDIILCHIIYGRHYIDQQIVCVFDIDKLNYNNLWKNFKHHISQFSLIFVK